MSELEPVKIKNAEAAMNEIIRGIRTLATSGEITLNIEDEND